MQLELLVWSGLLSIEVFKIEKKSTSFDSLSLHKVVSKKDMRKYFRIFADISVKNKDSQQGCP